MYLKNQFFCLYLAIIFVLIITVKCQYNNYQPQEGIIRFFTENADDETNVNGEIEESRFNTDNNSDSTPQEIEEEHIPSSHNSNSEKQSTSSHNSNSEKHSSSEKSTKELPKDKPKSNNNESNAVEEENMNKNLSKTTENEQPTQTSASSSTQFTRIEKTKPESIEKIEILREDLSLIKWSEFDNYGFKIAISTPNVFDDDSIVNIKWQTVNDFEPSSTIKIELHTNLTRRSNYLAYQTTETIVIDDSIPNNVKEINWNPNIKLKKNEKYFIRIWAYTNNNTATMSGLCIWSINTLLPDKEENTKQAVKGKGLIKKIAFPGIGALLCFTVIGHFVLEGRKERKYKNLNDDDYSEVDSHDGLNKNRGESIYYDAIKSEHNAINILNSTHPLPQQWELEAKRKCHKLNQSLSDGNSSTNHSSSSSDEVSIVLNDTNQPISLTIEKPTVSKLQKIPKFPDGMVQTHKHHHHHHRKHSSSGSSNDSRALLIK